VKLVLAGSTPVDRPKWKMPLNGWQLVLKTRVGLLLGVSPSETLRERFLHLPSRFCIGCAKSAYHYNKNQEVRTMPKIFEVGGKVRDELLGLKSKDADFAFVLTEQEAAGLSIDDAFLFMSEWMLAMGFQIFLSKPDCVTIRARFFNSSQTADFVLAKRELKVMPGNCEPKAVPGSLEDDLLRRDFTVNAMAKARSGELIDLFDGQKDLSDKVLRTPIDPRITLADDPLRALRAIRFSVKLGFHLDAELVDALHDPALPELMSQVSTDRVREELARSMKIDTWGTLQMLQQLPEALVRGWLDRPGMWLMPTVRG
jgi:tRNA nucleotidyltransferase/poly(A) polymerase